MRRAAARDAQQQSLGETTELLSHARAQLERATQPWQVERVAESLRSMLGERVCADYYATEAEQLLRSTVQLRQTLRGGDRPPTGTTSAPMSPMGLFPTSPLAFGAKNLPPLGGSPTPGGRVAMRNTPGGMLSVTVKHARNLIQPEQLSAGSGCLHVLVGFGGHQQTSKACVASGGDAAPQSRQCDCSQTFQFEVLPRIPAAECAVELTLIHRTRALFPVTPGEEVDQFLGSARVKIDDWGRLRSSCPLVMDAHLEGTLRSQSAVVCDLLIFLTDCM